MICCSQNDIVGGKEYDRIISQLKEFSIQVDPIWRGLYYCLDCGSYWEELFVDDRLVGRPYLKHIAMINCPQLKNRWLLLVLTLARGGISGDKENIEI